MNPWNRSSWTNTWHIQRRLTRVAQYLVLQYGAGKSYWGPGSLEPSRPADPARTARLEQAVRGQGLKLSDEQVRLLERFSPEFRDRHIGANHTGDLVAVNTFMVGSLKGVGRVFLQPVIDCHSRYAWNRLYTSKLPLTAVHVLNEDVLPFFEQHETRIETILSDNGREFCGRPDKHPYELFLQLEGIEHRTTKVRRPQNNDFVERLHRTLFDEHFRIQCRQAWYETVEEMQYSLESYLQHYNLERPHQGRGMNGRTPYAFFLEGLLKGSGAQPDETNEAA